MDLNVLFSKGTKFQLREISGDLFSAPSNFSIGHCVAADLKMGKGIAVKFRDKFGRIAELKEQSVKTGGVAVLKDEKNNRYIYYLVTKDLSYQKPTYESLAESLMAMKDHIEENDVQFLALPKIGCGLDGLNWRRVADLLNGIFDGVNLKIIVYNFGPI